MHNHHLKIALCGVPGSGKTVLAKALSKKLTLPLVYQGTKELRATTDIGKVPPFWRMNEIDRIQYQLKLIQYRLDTEKGYNEFVADGCALDLIAWYRMCTWLLPFDQKYLTMKVLDQLARTYDLVFYLPFYSPPEKPKDKESEFDAVDPFNLLTADYILKGTIAHMVHNGRPVYVIETPQFLPSNSPDEDNVQVAINKRVEEVLSVILAMEEKSTSASVM